MDKLEKYTIEIGNVKSELQEVNRREGTTKKIDKALSVYEEWEKKFSHCTHEHLTNCGKQLLEPTKEYYTKLFDHAGGDCSDIKYTAEPAELFDLINLSHITVTETVTKLHYLEDRFVCYKYDFHFTEGFIKRLKK